MEALRTWFQGLRGKLLIMVILPVAVMALSALVALRALELQDDNAKLIAKDRMPKITTLLRLRINAEAAVRFLWATTGFDKVEIRKNKAENSQKKFKAFSDEYSNLLGMKDLEEGFKASMKSMYEDWKIVETYSLQATELLLVNKSVSDKAAKRLIEEKLIPLYLKQLDIIAQNEKALQAQVDTSVVTAEASSQQSQNRLVLIGILSTIGLFAVGFLIASHLANSLSKVSNQVHSAGSQVEVAGEQLSSASQTLSSGATESASALEETVASLEELSSIVKMNADNAKEAASLSAQSTRSAEDGESEIRILIAAMADITDSSKKIEEIINVIDDIAFQTNLLALNAAVEAARAGEQGKGFAVVAEAVRNLALRSASAAKDINTLIKDSVNKTDRGAKIADLSGAVLKNIVSSIKKVSDLNSEIASASAEQARGISQISKAMNELDSATQTNAASAEEVAASSEELSAQSVSLQSMVGDLKKVIDGTDGTAKHAPSREDYGFRSSSSRSGRKSPHLRVVSGGKHHFDAQARRPKVEQVIPFDDELPPVKKVGSTDEF
jgi:methyl-accepting chemotaxis protein